MTASNHNQPAAPWCNCGFRFRAYKRGRLNTAWKERCFCVETPKRGERRPSIRCVAGSVKPVLATISYGKEGGESIQGTIEVVGMKAFGTQFEIYSASGRTYFLCLESEEDAYKLQCLSCGEGGNVNPAGKLPAVLTHARRQSSEDSAVLTHTHRPSSKSSIESDDEWSISSLQKAVDLAPQDADAQYELGVFYHLSDDAERAEEAYRTALSLEPTHADAIYQLALLLGAEPQCHCLVAPSRPCSCRASEKKNQQQKKRIAGEEPVAPRPLKREKSTGATGALFAMRMAALV